MPSVKKTLGIRAQLKKAEAKVAELQEKYPPISETWQKLKTIDDCLHEIATLLGD